MVALADADAQPPDAAIVLFTVYVPGVLADRLISPVVELIERPAGRVGEIVNVAAPPVLVGVRELIATVGAPVTDDGEYAMAGGAKMNSMFCAIPTMNPQLGPSARLV